MASAKIESKSFKRLWWNQSPVICNLFLDETIPISYGEWSRNNST